MKATKGNKSYTIDETQKKHYKDAGYDILGDDGSIQEYGRGKTVPYEEYAALRNALAEHEKKLDALQKEDNQELNQDVINLLKCLAQEHGVDLGKTTSLSGIVKKFKEHKPEGGE